MEIIATKETPAVKKVHTRSVLVTIQNPWEGIPTIRFQNENRLLLDGKSAASLPCPSLTRKLPDVASQTITINDPVTKKKVTISVAGVGEAIASLFCRWFKEDNP
jgi:hypothetical protein